MSNTKFNIPKNKYSLILPQSYDNTITFIEFMNKLLYVFEHDANYTVTTEYNSDEQHLTIYIKSAEREN